MQAVRLHLLEALQHPGQVAVIVDDGDFPVLVDQIHHPFQIAAAQGVEQLGVHHGRTGKFRAHDEIGVGDVQLQIPPVHLQHPLRHHIREAQQTVQVCEGPDAKVLRTAQVVQRLQRVPQVHHQQPPFPQLLLFTQKGLSVGTGRYIGNFRDFFQHIRIIHIEFDCGVSVLLGHGFLKGQVPVGYPGARPARSVNGHAEDLRVGVVAEAQIRPPPVHGVAEVLNGRRHRPVGGDVVDVGVVLQRVIGGQQPDGDAVDLLPVPQSEQPLP